MDELLKLLKEMKSEVTELRAEVSALKYEMHDRKIRSTWMDMKDVCEYLHISMSTMKNRMNAGEFAFGVKKGRKWMFPAEKIKRYACNNVVS